MRRPEDADATSALLRGFVFPPVIFDPGPEYGPDARNYKGIPGIERAPGGRLCATWYAGPVWEDRFNYALVATIGDDGITLEWFLSMSDASCSSTTS